MIKQKDYKFGDPVTITMNGENFGKCIGSFFCSDRNAKCYLVAFAESQCQDTFFHEICSDEQTTIDLFSLPDGLKFDLYRVAKTNPSAKFFITQTNIKDNANNLTLNELIDNLKNEIKI